MILHRKIYGKRLKNEVGKLSQQNRVIKFDIDVGFTVDVGKYFMTKDTEECSQFTDSLACREYILWEMKKSLTRKVGFEGTPKLTPFGSHNQQFNKEFLEWKFIRIDSANSWVRISHGLNKLVTDLSNEENDDNEQEISEMQFDNFALRRGKKVNWCWVRKLFARRLPSVKTTEYSSSSWSSTSRRRWSDWILEIKGLSSERSWAISTLVWWNSWRVQWF